MGLYNAAGTYNIEDDRSYFVSLNVNLRLGAVFAATWGPTLSDTLTAPTLCTSRDSFVETFGKPKSTWVAGTSVQYGWYTVSEYFRKGRLGQLVRVDALATADQAKKAKGALRGARTKIMVDRATGTFSLPAVRTLTDAGVNFLTSGVKIGHFLKIKEGAPDNGNNGLYIVTNVAANVLTVNRDWPVDGSGWGADIDYEVHTTVCAVKANGTTGTKAARTLTSVAVNNETFTTSGVAAGDIVVINDSTVGETGCNGVYLVDSVTDATHLVVDRDWPADLSGVVGLALDFTVYKSRPIINPDAANGGGPGVAAPASGTGWVDAGDLDALQCDNAYFTLWGVAVGDIVVINEPAPDTGCNGTYIVTVVDSNTKVTLDRNLVAHAGKTLDFYVLTTSIRLEGYYKGTRANSFTAEVRVHDGQPLNWTLELKESGVLLETWSNINRATIETATNASLYFNLPANAVIADASEPVQTTERADLAETPFAAGYTFHGGTDGDSAILNSDIIAALNLFKNKDQVLIDVLAAGGCKAVSVQAAMKTIQETRKDCVVLQDPPEWATLDAAGEFVQWTNGLFPGYAKSVSGSAEWTAWPWYQIYDEYNDINIWCPPSGAFLYAACKSSEEGGPWKAPAGPRRGLLPHALAVQYALTFDERDMMQAEAECANPIILKAGRGVMLYGQHSGLRTSSSLNRINNRMTLTLLEGTVGDYLADLEFEASDSVLWGLIKAVLDKACANVKGKGGLSNYAARCDAATNDPSVLPSANSAQAYCWVEFPQTAERIYVKWIITPAGVTFEEYVGNFTL